MYFFISSRPQVVEKKKRSAVMCSLGLVPQAPNAHVFDHPLAKRCGSLTD
jgi:hypothetical protein